MRWLKRQLPLLLASWLASAAAAANDNSEGPEQEYTSFDTPISNLVYFDDSDTLLFSDLATGDVWQSSNAGFSWDTLANVKEAIEIIKHPYDKQVAVILGAERTHYITKDQGKKWNEFSTPDYVRFMGRPIAFHATDSDRILIQTANCEDIFCSYPIYYTLDGFDTRAELLHENVLSCLWAKTTARFTTGDEDLDKSRILCNVEGEFSFFEADSRILVSDDFFETKGVEPLLDYDRPVSGIINIATVTGYLAAAAKSVGSNELALYVSADSQLWHRAEFGNHTIEEDAYTILESTNYSMQVDVMTNDDVYMGVLFTSNSNGTFFTRNIGNTNRNAMGYVDFEKVSNIPGIVLVNTISNAEDIEEGGRKVEKKLVTQISFDDGRTWQSLQLGKKNLHLHSVTDQINTGRVFSSPAPGIIMGVGNTGTYLKAREDGDTYVSDDAGVTWQEALDGPHLYEMGDQGAILVAVPDDSADKIYWSLDHGKEWQSTPLEHKIQPLALTTTSDSTSLKFILVARPLRSDYEGSFEEIIALDFSSLKKPTCGNKDFENWSALVDEDDNPKCFMGHTLEYRRRKADADCFVNHEYKDPVPLLTNCKCRDEDYECDYNFIKSGSACVPAGPLAAAPRVCLDGDETYEGPSGYRLIPGNTCEQRGGVVKDEPVTRKCSETIAPVSGEINSTTTTFKESTFVEFFYLERCEKCTGEDETIVAHSDRGKVYKTHDHGKTWTQLNFKEDIVAIYPHEYFNDQVFFLTEKKIVYYSKNRVQTTHDFETPEPPNRGVAALSFHPKQPDWLIWTGDRSGQTIAQISRKHGDDDWLTLLRDVRKCNFISSELRPNSSNLVYCEQFADEDPTGALTLVGSNDWFTEDKVELKRDVVDFATMAEFIIVAVKDNEDSLKVDASIDGRTFADARFPQNFQVDHQRAYTVLDSSTHSVFLHVTVNNERGAEYGSILKSNSNGTQYVMSISLVNKATNGYVDFEKVLSLEGVAVVNVVGNVDEATNGKGKKLKTMITHNDGAEWATIQRPESSGDFKTDWCSGGAEVCSLHLHGYTERDDPRRTYSSPSAIGLMIANGNVGEYLGELSEADTFMSRDGGVEWSMVGQGTWSWAFGDRGSIVVLAEKHKSVKVLKYTLDEGQTWAEYQFTDDTMIIDRISTVPSDTSRNFLLWGAVDGKLATINIDFSGLKERSEKCSLDEKNPQSDKDDYYLWSPKHPLQQDDCLFGHVAQYHRKLIASKCYNGQSLPTLHDISENCKCTRQDFECDYNFERQTDGSCKLVAGLEPANPQDICYKDSSVKEYYDVTGYRRLALTTCQGGKELDYTSQTHPCPDYQDEWEGKHGLSGAGLFFAIVIPIAAASAAGWYVWRNWDGKFGRIQLGDGAAGSRIGLGGAFERDAPWIKYPVLAVSAVITIVAAIPMVVSTVYRSLSARFGRGSGRYDSYGGGSRPYTSRSSFQRGRGNYSVVDPDDGELLGDESEDEQA